MKIHWLLNNTADMIQSVRVLFVLVSLVILYFAKRLRFIIRQPLIKIKHCLYH